MGERYRCGGMFYDGSDIPAVIASGDWGWHRECRKTATHS